jgi:hypothetical protein
MVAVCDSSDGTSDVVLINTKSQAEPTSASDGLFPAPRHCGGALRWS